MSRIQWRDLTPGRVAAALWRRMADLPDALAWGLPTPFVAANRARLAAFKDRHRGERCFVMANGPSLATMELSALEGQVTFGLNRIYLLFDRLPFRPTYYACVNELVLEQFASEIGRLSMPKFLNWNRRRLFDARDASMKFVRLAMSLQDAVRTDLLKPISSGGTVTFVALQLAYVMGFSEVVLIGLDHSFASKGTPNKVEVRRAEKDADHFHPDYFPKGVKWQLPDLYRSELAYALARQAFEADGRRILDATRGGHCEVFEKVDFESVIR
jgi:hypothetical protein